MKKIISLFQRNYDGDRLIRDEVVPGAEWVLAGEGTPTRKYDGTCVLVEDGVMWKRYEVKKGKTPPRHQEEERIGMEQFLIPDFVVVGAQRDGQVLLFASKSLTSAELKVVMDQPDFRFPPDRWTCLTAELCEYIVVQGESYPAAWQALFECWTPGSTEKAELENRKELHA